MSITPEQMKINEDYAKGVYKDNPRKYALDYMSASANKGTITPGTNFEQPTPNQLNPATGATNVVGLNPTLASSTSTTAPQSNINDILALIEKNKQLQLQSGSAGLETTRAEALRQLQQERESAKTSYAGQRSAETTSSTLRADRLGKLMRDMGYSEGTQAQRAINENASLAGNIGALRTAEEGAYRDIESRETLANTNYQSGLQKLQADSEFQAIQNQISEMTRLQGIQREDKQIADELARSQTEKTQAQEREDFNTKIMANYQNISAFVNQLKEVGAPQWQIDQADAARVQKIIENGLNPETGMAQPVDNTQAIIEMAQWKWNNGMPLTQQEMQSIGATTATKPVKSTGGSSGGSSTTVTQDRNYQLDRWEILGKADQAIADVWGVPVGTSFKNKPEDVEPIDTSTYEDYISTYLTTSDGGATKLDRNGVALYLVKLYNAGKREEAAALAANYGIDDATIELAERILGNQR